MRARLLCLLVVSGCAASREPAERPWPQVDPDRPFLLGGIQVNEADHDHWIGTLEKIGMNTVAVTVYAKQGDWDGANLWYDEDAPSVIDEIRRAKAAGLEVVLVLRVALDHAFPRNQFLWHGMIMPTTDEELDEWFRRYGLFVEKWAAIAEREGVDVLGVASELSSLTSTREVEATPELVAYWLDEAQQARYLALVDRLAEGEVDLAPLVKRQDAHRVWAEKVSHRGDPDAVARINRRRKRLERHWRLVVERVRTGYSGKLTYAANFDQYDQVTIWSVFDLIGINAYFKLRGSIDRPDDDRELLGRLEVGWQRVLAGLVDFRREEGLADKPIIFTELGYTQRRGSTLEPWSAGGFSVVGDGVDARLVRWDVQPEDLIERALAVRALTEALRRFEAGLLFGVLYWKLSTYPPHRSIEPFVLIIGGDGPPDPLEEALRVLGSEQRRPGQRLQ